MVSTEVVARDPQAGPGSTVSNDMDPNGGTVQRATSKINPN